MKNLLYMIRRHKLASALNLLGISLALATFYLFMTQVEHNATYNHCIKDYGRTFRLEHNGIFGADSWHDTNCRPMAMTMKDVPHVEDVTVCMDMDMAEQVPVETDDGRFAIQHSEADGHFLTFIGHPLLYGNIEDWKTRNTVIITRSEAMRIFGKEDAVGERLKNVREDYYYDIVGVCEDFPENCTAKNGIFQCLADNCTGDYTNWCFSILVRLDDKANKEDVEKAYKDILSDLDKHGASEGLHVRLTPVEDVYTSGVTEHDNGNSDLVTVLSMASFFILLIALLNFINFSLAETPMRIRSINTHKVMGASVAALRFGLVMESVALSMTALAIAAMMVLAFRSVPECMYLVTGSIDFAGHVQLSCITVTAALLIGILAALYPAWYSTSFKPALVLKGAFGLSPRGKQLRNAMLFLQFIVAFVLTAYTFIMHSQSHYIFNCDYGFAKDEVIFSDDLSEASKDKKDAIRQELEKLPCVTGVAFGTNELGASDSFTSWGRGSHEEGTYIYINVIAVDENYLRTMGLGIAEGRDFNATEPNGAWIVNKCAMRMYPRLKLNEPIGQWGQMGYDIVGVCEDFKAKSMRYDNSDTPVGFIVYNNEDSKMMRYNSQKFFVRIAAGYDKPEARRQVMDAIRKADPTWSGDMQFLDQKLQSTYEEEFRFISQVKVFAGISIAITLIGVFCLTMFETEYRRKEIAIRKIMGSSVAEVIMLFAGKYTIPLAVSFLVAAPLAYNLGNRWLENFAEHTPIHWWIFPASFIAVCTVVLLTVAVQCFKVATTNPIESIRTE